MPNRNETEIEKASEAVRSARLLLEDARMVGAPPDCVAERERDLAAAEVCLRDLMTSLENESDRIHGHL